MTTKSEPTSPIPTLNHRVLGRCPHLEVRNSPIEGFGVFATADIPAGTLLEEVPFVLFPRYTQLSKEIFQLLRINGWASSKELYMENLRDNMGFKHPDRYYVKWHPPVMIDSDSMYTVLPLGFGPVYNTSNTNNNADWKMLRDTFTFKAEKDIKADDEVCTFYGYFLGNDGAIFNCESVFHLAIDMFDTPKGPRHKIKMMRFGNLDTYQTQRNNPAALKINTLITKSTDGLTLKNMFAMQGNGNTVASADISEDINLTLLYSRLVEVKNHPTPLVRFLFEYEDKQTHQIVTDEIVWKK